MTNIKTIVDGNGDYIAPRTIADAVKYDETRSIKDVIDSLPTMEDVSRAIGDAIAQAY